MRGGGLAGAVCPVFRDGDGRFRRRGGRWSAYRSDRANVAEVYGLRTRLQSAFSVAATSSVHSEPRLTTYDADYEVVLISLGGDILEKSVVQLRQIGSPVDSGSLRPVLDRVLPFEETRQAPGLRGERSRQGKVVEVR